MYSIVALPALMRQTSAHDFQSPFLALTFARTQPASDFLAVDSLGQSKTNRNTILSEPAAESAVTFAETGPATFEYRKGSLPIWTIKCGERSIQLTARYARDAPPFRLHFDQRQSFATLLGLMKPGEQLTNLPAVLHLPDMGSFRITGSDPYFKLPYDAARDTPQPFVDISFPPATESHPKVEYALDVVAIHPELPGIAKEPIFDGFRRSYLNVFQVNPRRQMLANNSASDICTFTVFEYAEVAKAAGPMVLATDPATGVRLTCWDLVRMTLDRYLSGVKGYGQPGYQPNSAGPWTLLDVYPSLLIAATDYAEGAPDLNWARANYSRLAAWGKEMFAMDTDGDGLLKYPATGNSGDRPKPHLRPANWWDTIGFGHEDAWSNALAYRAGAQLADLARRLGKTDDFRFFEEHAEKLRKAYVPAFLDPETGVLAGWRSQDGKLHDYWFTFVNGVAIVYGLVDRPLADQIMDRVMRKFAEVGYNRFDLGIPGNLIPVRKADYVQHGVVYTESARGFGEPNLDDGSDAFQFYENGGATACWAYYTVKALYDLGRIDEARRIYLPMLKSFAEGGFAGFAPSGYSVDWRDWKGGAHGYEGLLTDGYLSLLAVFDEVKARR